MTEKEALVALNLVPGLGVAQIMRWRESLGSYSAVFMAETGELCQSAIRISETRVAELVAEIKSARWEEEMARAERDKVRLLTLADDDYPALLRQIHLPPPVLYCRGDIGCLNRCNVSVIGSRNASAYGMQSAKKIAAALADAGVGVVSGLATGIDAAAHSGALEGGGATVGVLGGALNCFYPSENIGLARRMVENNGAVISEFPYGVNPGKTTFPRRNRIVSGLSRCIVAVETSLRGGTMITVDCAIRQNRSVMAVPGRIDSFRSAGCNRLIRDGAGIVTEAEDIFRELGEFFPKSQTSRKAASGAVPDTRTASLCADEKTVWEELSDEPHSPEVLIERTGLDAGRLGAALIGLQMRKLARSLPGGMVERIN